MTAVELLADLVRAGASVQTRHGRLVVEAPPGVLTEDAVARVRAREAEVMRGVTEVSWRVAVMRRQVPPRPAPIPLLVARPDVRPRPGDCVSCRVRLTDPSSGARCPLCSLAALMVLRDTVQPLTVA